jgi:nitroreductase
MNPVITTLMNRKSIRAYEERPVPMEIRAEILAATLRAPTAGNQMLYTILDVTDQALKERLAVTCDDQPFIATAPMVWLFLADLQRWYDFFRASGVEEACAHKGLDMRRPAEGDLLIACCDALIAAQQAVIAAESFGLGSCYIGDIMERYEVHREILSLPQWTFPVTMVCFGYPTEQAAARPTTSRFAEKYIVFENRYHRLDRAEFDAMFAERERLRPENLLPGAPANAGQATYFRKFGADFSVELTRSVRAAIQAWCAE